MLLTQHRPSYAKNDSLPSARALLLCAENLTPEDRRLTEILDLFGIPWQVLTAAKITGASLPGYGVGHFCILSSASYLAEVIGSSQDSGDWLPHWMKGASSVFLYGFQDTASCRQLVRSLTGDAHAEIRHLNQPHVVASIADGIPEMCGPMSGLRVCIEPAEGDLLFAITRQAAGFQSIIRSNEGEFFLSITNEGVRFYLSGGSTITDIRSPHANYFDVKKHFCGAVPTVMYLKWAFREVCWNGFETSGCLVIDDPPLKPRYGFLHYREVLELMDQRNFTTTIAFIPWNWQRTNPRTVDMFRNRPDRFSLCIHGSDHMGSEFATRSTAQLNRSIKTALQRMELLHQKTFLEHARVMVFPRGAFSPEAGRVLKLNGFMAGVNTEVAPADSAENKTTIADLWSLAIMNYGTFPIFTRRYLTHGIENFAFDGILGKSCLIVGHHDAFKNDGRNLVEFIDKLNSLKWNLRWRPLGDLVRRSFDVRYEADGRNVIRMFAHNLVIESQSAEPRQLTFLKEETDPDCVKAVLVNQCLIDFSYEDRFLCWNAKLSPGGTAEARIVYFEGPDLVCSAESIGYKIKTRARRYLSEFRDNYLDRSNFLLESAARIRRFLK